MKLLWQPFNEKVMDCSHLQFGPPDLDPVLTHVLLYRTSSHSETCFEFGRFWAAQRE
jgi:hypothetical protein